MPELRVHAVLALAALLAACAPATRSAPPAPAASVTIEPEEDWRRTALPEHAGISEDLPPLFRSLAAAAAQARGGADRELLDADRLLARVAPAPGAYRCRLVRLPPPAGARRERSGGRSGFCFVGAEGERLSLTLETPARRIGGYLWESADSRRLVFLGAAFAPPARTAPPYATPGASTAGLFERIGDFRYRLIVRGSAPGTLDVYELVAAPPGR